MLAALLAVVLTGTAAASSIRVSPVRLQVDPQRPVTSLAVTNTGDEAIFMQTSTWRWREENGASAYDATDRITVSPPIFEVPPGQRQVVRFAVHEPPQPGLESIYRIYLTEVLPEAGQAGAGGGIRMGIRFGVPLFLTPPDAAAELAWRYLVHCGEPRIVGSNQGSAHARVHRLAVAAHPDGGGRTEIERPAYLLPGMEKTWPIADGDGPFPGSVSLTVKDDRGETNLVLDAQGPPTSCH